MIGYGISGNTHDFFCFNSSGQVWNGSAFVTWADGDYVSYRVTATEVGTTGRFTGTAPSGTETYELRERGASLALSYVTWTDDQKIKDDAANAATEVNKIPRSSASLTAGAATRRNKVAATSTTLDETIEATP